MYVCCLAGYDMSGQQQPQVPAMPTFPGQQLLSDPMMNSMAMTYGQNIADGAKTMIDEKVSSVFRCARPVHVIKLTSCQEPLTVWVSWFTNYADIDVSFSASLFVDLYSPELSVKIVCVYCVLVAKVCTKQTQVLLCRRHSLRRQEDRTSSLSICP